MKNNNDDILKILPEKKDIRPKEHSCFPTILNCDTCKRFEVHDKVIDDSATKLNERRVGVVNIAQTLWAMRSTRKRFANYDKCLEDAKAFEEKYIILKKEK